MQRAALQGSSAASTSGRTSARQGQASVSSRTAVNNAQDSTNATPAGDLQQPAEQNARVPPQATMMDIDEQGPARHPDLTESEPPNTPNKKRKTVDSNTGSPQIFIKESARAVAIAPSCCEAISDRLPCLSFLISYVGMVLADRHCSQHTFMLPKRWYVVVWPRKCHFLVRRTISWKVCVSCR